MILTDKDKLVETTYDVFFLMYPNWTVDHLLANPRDAIALCDAVRTRLGKELADHQILGPMINRRKQGGLPARRKAS